MTALPIPATDRTDVLSDYRRFVATLPCGQQGKRLRLTAAGRFLAAHPDLDVWMALPTPTRLAHVRRYNAWTLLTWCFAEGVVVPDVDLIGAKAKGGHFSAWVTGNRPAVDRARQVAAQLGWGERWIVRVCEATLAMVCLTTTTRPEALTAAVLEEFESAMDAAPTMTAHAKKVHRAQLYGVRQVCYQQGLLDEVPRQAWRRDISLADRAAKIPQPAIAAQVGRYLQTITTVLRPKTVTGRAASLEVFFAWLADARPDIESLHQLSRGHIEDYIAYAHGRPWRGRVARDRPVSTTHTTHQLVDLKVFLDDLAAWGWADQPARTVLHRTDIPRQPRRLPRALAPDIDAALMGAVDRLEDVYPRCAILILRGTGLRIGELLDLELDCLWDLAGHGTWLKVPLGKLNTERVVPLDEPTLAAFDTWTTQRGHQRALPHPRDGRPTDFLFAASGRRMTAKRIREGLAQAAINAGLTGVDGQPLRPTPHQLRHTYATSLANAGMNLQALMALLGHATPEMTMRYAALADTTLRTAYDTAIAKIPTRTRLPLLGTPPPPAPVPDRIGWLRSEMLKTRVAHGYCSRHLAADACPYANICEGCDNYVTTPEFLPALKAQATDIQALRDDATTRGWTSETARHDRTLTAINSHIRRHERAVPYTLPLDPPPRAG